MNKLKYLECNSIRKVINKFFISIILPQAQIVAVTHSLSGISPTVSWLFFTHWVDLFALKFLLELHYPFSLKISHSLTRMSPKNSTCLEISLSASALWTAAIHSQHSSKQFYSAARAGTVYTA